jgi:hypothetical protein
MVVTFDPVLLNEQLHNYRQCDTCKRWLHVTAGHSPHVEGCPAEGCDCNRFVCPDHCPDCNRCPRCKAPWPDDDHFWSCEGEEE